MHVPSWVQAPEGTCAYKRRGLTNTTLLQARRARAGEPLPEPLIAEGSNRAGLTDAVPQSDKQAPPRHCRASAVPALRCPDSVDKPINLRGPSQLQSRVTGQAGHADSPAITSAGHRRRSLPSALDYHRLPPPPSMIGDSSNAVRERRGSPIHGTATMARNAALGGTALQREWHCDARARTGATWRRRGIGQRVQPPAPTTHIHHICTPAPHPLSPSCRGGAAGMPREARRTWLSRLDPLDRAMSLLLAEGPAGSKAGVLYTRL